MESKINNRYQSLIGKRLELLKDYDWIKVKINRALSDGILNVALTLLQKLECINVEIECIDKELEFLKTL